MRTRREYGDLKTVVAMTKARRMGKSKSGFSYDYVKKVLNPKNKRRNADIEALHQELAALRKAKPRKSNG